MVGKLSSRAGLAWAFFLIQWESDLFPLDVHLDPWCRRLLPAIGYGTIVGGVGQVAVSADPRLRVRGRTVPTRGHAGGGQMGGWRWTFDPPRLVCYSDAAP